MRLTLTATLALAASAHAASGWANSCSGAKVQGGFLIANCINSSGLTNQSQLNLNACFVNVHGLMDCGAGTRSGNTMNTCNNCSVSGSTIACDCLTGSSGSRSRSFLDSNRCIGNRNGSLWC